MNGKVETRLLRANSLFYIISPIDLPREPVPGQESTMPYLLSIVLMQRAISFRRHGRALASGVVLTSRHCPSTHLQFCKHRANKAFMTQEYIYCYAGV